MTTAIATQEQFQEQMKARIRAAAGELMPDEMLQDIVKRGIEDAFFKPRKTFDNYNRVIESEPWLTEFLRAEVKSQIEKEVRAWLKANPDKISELVESLVREGAGKAVIEALNYMMKYEFQSFGESLARRLTS